MAVASNLANAGTVTYPSTNYDEQYRGQFHFSAPGGWLNDANGMWYADGLYYLAYQHTPYGLASGEKWWGLATSPDMLHWTQKPIMLDPAVVPGSCWSGSTVIDTENTSGLKTGANPVWVAIYTATSKGTCLAYSNDLGASWQPYSGNPVNVGGPNEETRDPHVFWYAPASKWVCLLFEKGTSFYTSTDLKNWTKTCHIDFGFECPDMYELPIDGDASHQKWVVQDASGKYLLGDFDGSTFTPDAGGPYPMDVGPGYYASQTFNRASFPDSRVVQIAWNAAWNNQPYTQPWQQSLSFPCEIKLKTSREGVRVSREPIAEIAKLYSNTHHYGAQTLKPGQNLFAGKESECCDVEVDFDLAGSTAKNITFTFANLTFNYDVANRQLLGKPLSPINNKIKIRVLRDWGQIEVFGNDGQFSYTDPYGFTTGDGGVSVTTDGDIDVVSADFRNVNRIWPGKAGIPARTIDDADPATVYSGTWNTDNNNFYYTNTCHFGGTVGGYFEAPFHGTHVEWWGLQNVDLGFADVYVDGAKVAEGIDCYSTIRTVRKMFSKSGLSTGSHTIKVVVTGSKNAASTGVALVHDYFVVK